MALFGFGTKRKPATESSMPRVTPGFDAPTSLRRLTTPAATCGANQPTGVEVSEFDLDDDDFSSMFGGPSTQFSDALELDDPSDPWIAKRRID